MQRYFFDVIDDESRTKYDFKGCEFENDRKAMQHAELIAIDLALSADAEESARQEIRMRTATGALLFSIPVRSDSSLLAA